MIFDVLSPPKAKGIGTYPVSIILPSPGFSINRLFQNVTYGFVTGCRPAGKERPGNFSPGV